MSNGMIIGLTGLAGCGKSTLANYLVEKHGFERLSFAGPLKKMIRTLNPILGITDNEGGEEYGEVRAGDLQSPELGWSEADIKESEFGPEYRRLLQVLGTNCIRSVDDYFWVNAAGKQLESYTGNYVFDDVRFPNEAEAIRDGFNRRTPGTLWNIPREGLLRGEHSSEQWAGKMDENFHLPNDGTPEELFRQADCIIKHLEGIRDAKAFNSLER